MTRRSRLARATFVSLALALGVLVALEVAFLIPYLESQQALGADHRFFTDIARRWLDTGEFYLPRQLSGSYEVETLVDVLYPPFALYLFVPFVVLPGLLWWAIPVVVFAGSITYLRPAPWTWPLIMAGVAWPQSVSQFLYGNTNMWVAAAIAAGVVLAWPSVLVLLKPSLAPFALIGIHRRRWWAAMVVLALASLPFGAMWLDYVTAMRNSSLGALHGLVTLPLMLAPLVAWVGRQRKPRRHLEADAPAEAVPDVHDLPVTQVQ